MVKVRVLHHPTLCLMFKAQVKVLRIGLPSSLVVPATRRMAVVPTQPAPRTTCPSTAQEQWEQPAPVLQLTTQRLVTQTHLRAMKTSDVIYLKKNMKLRRKNKFSYQDIHKNIL